MIDYDTFAQDIQDSVTILRSSIPAPADQLRLLPGVYTSMQSYSGITAAMIRQTLLSSIARAVSEYDLTSRGEAEAILTQIVPLYDAEIGMTNDYTAYQALRELKAALIDDLQTRGLRLPELITKTYRRSLPSLVLAHDLYLDATRADEIVIRNDPRHPLFCGMSVEVLSS